MRKAAAAPHAEEQQRTEKQRNGEVDVWAANFKKREGNDECAVTPPLYIRLRVSHNIVSCFQLLHL